MDAYISKSSLRAGPIIYTDGLNLPTFYVLRHMLNDDNAKEKICFDKSLTFV